MSSSRLYGRNVSSPASTTYGTHHGLTHSRSHDSKSDVTTCNPSQTLACTVIARSHDSKSGVTTCNLN